MKIGVTAAESKLGEEVTTNLLQFTNKENIILITTKPQKLATSGLVVRNADFDNYSVLSNTLKDVDVLIFLSSNIGSSFIEYQNELLIKACKENNIKKIIFCSLIGNPFRKDEYSLLVNAYRSSEELLENQEIPFSVVRTSRFIESVLDELSKERLNSFVSSIGKTGLCAYTSRSEVAYILAKNAFTKENSNKTYQISGEKVSPQKLLSAINLIYKSNYQQSDVNDAISKAIDRGDFEVNSDYYEITNKQHKPLLDIIKTYHELNRSLVVSEFKPFITTKTPM